jgi:hypothetical protein
MHALDSYTLTGYVFRNSKMKIGAASESDLDDVEIFVKDLRHHCRKQDSVTSFFDSLDGLSVGPSGPWFPARALSRIWMS